MAMLPADAAVAIEQRVERGTRDANFGNAVGVDVDDERRAARAAAGKGNGSVRRRVPDLRVAAVVVQHVHEAIGHDHDFGERIVIEVRDRHVAVDAVGALPDLRQLTVDEAIGGRPGDDLRDAVQIDIADRGDGRTAAGAGGRASSVRPSPINLPSASNTELPTMMCGRPLPVRLAIDMAPPTSIDLSPSRNCGIGLGSLIHLTAPVRSNAIR